MNSTEETYNGGRLGVIEQVKGMDMFLTRIFRATESLIVTDTYQFNDYSKVVATGFDEQRKAKRRKEIFPQDCQKAFELGVRLVTR